MNTLKKYFPLFLLVLYLITFLLCAINPFHWGLWAVENTSSILIVYFLIVSYRKFRFSNTSYFLISFFVILQTIGGHYALENVPIDWFTNMFGFERNNFDRIVHFCVGFFAFPMAELIYRKKLTNTKWVLYSFPLFFIMFIASTYEIIEWIYTLIVANGNPEANGIQGDIWDAQKDMLLDFSGAILVLSIFALKNKWKIKSKYAL